MWCSNRSDTNHTDADQLRSYCEADLGLCFRICSLLVYYDAVQMCLFVPGYKTQRPIGNHIFCDLDFSSLDTSVLLLCHEGGFENKSTEDHLSCDMRKLVFGISNHV